MKKNGKSLESQNIWKIFLNKAWLEKQKENTKGKRLYF